MTVLSDKNRKKIGAHLKVPAMLTLAMLIVLALMAGGCSSFVVRNRYNDRKPSSFGRLYSLDPKGDNDETTKDGEEEEEDWRAFRARLVMNEALDNSSSSSSSKSTPTTSSPSEPLSSWTYDTGTFVEQGSIVISRVESSLGCHDLRQPYFGKCVILIVEHTPEFTQGIILNRPSNIMLNDNDIIYDLDDGDDGGSGDGDDPADFNDLLCATDESNGCSWSMSFGGDISSIYDSENPLIVCLHNLTNSELAQSVSDTILPGVYITSHLSARQLVSMGVAQPESFFTFFGFCGWDPGQLDKELDRGSWYMLSTDPKTLWNELDVLRQPTYDPRSAGIDMWHNIMGKLGRGEEANDDDEDSDSSTRANNGLQFSTSAFADLMLKEWATERLYVANETVNDSDIYRELFAADRSQQQTSQQIQAGTILRASSNNVSPFLVGQEQFFHKSTILILQESDICSIGVMLNLPTTDSYQIQLDDGTIVDFIIRYGGPGGGGGSDDEDEYEDAPFLWLHCSQTLKKMGIGKSLAGTFGKKFGAWSCSIDQVIEALESNLATPDDFLVVQGFCVWEKEENDLAGGMLGQVISGNFEIVPSIGCAEAREDTKLQGIWSRLSSQRILSDYTLNSNANISEETWNLCGNDKASINKAAVDVGDSRFVYDTNVKVSTLADQALLAWMKIYLLGTAEYYV